MGKHGTRRSTTAKKPKTKLGLPDLDHSKAAVLDSLRSPESKRGCATPLRRTGADPIPAGPPLGPNNRTLSRLQTADPRSGERSDRHRTVAALLRGGSATMRPSGLVPISRRHCAPYRCSADQLNDRPSQRTLITPAERIPVVVHPTEPCRRHHDEKRMCPSRPRGGGAMPAALDKQHRRQNRGENRQREQGWQPCRRRRARFDEVEMKQVE